MDAPGKDGNASMPEQVKRPNPWMIMIIIIIIIIIIITLENIVTDTTSTTTYFQFNFSHCLTTVCYKTLDISCLTFLPHPSSTKVCTVVPLDTVASRQLVRGLCNGPSFRTVDFQSTQSSQITASLTNIFPFVHKPSSDAQNTNINHRHKMFICWQKYK